MNDLQRTIDAAWEIARDALRPRPRRRPCARPWRTSSTSSTRGACASPRKQDGEWIVHQWVKKAVLLSFRLDRQCTDRSRGAGARRSASTTRCRRNSRSTTTPHSRAAGVRVVPPAVARRGAFIAKQRRADAVVRQHRRLRRRGHDGRHVGDGRLVRADRPQRPPVGRRRHRRRAGAAAGESDDHRGQLLHRRALRGRRGRDRRGELGARHGRVHRPEHEDLRSRDRRGQLRPRAVRVGRRRRQPAVGHRRLPALLRGDRQAGRRERRARRRASTSCCARDADVGSAQVARG